MTAEGVQASPFRTKSAETTDAGPRLAGPEAAVASGFTIPSSDSGVQTETSGTSVQSPQSEAEAVESRDGSPGASTAKTPLAPQHSASGISSATCPDAKHSTGIHGPVVISSIATTRIRAPASAIRAKSLGYQTPATGAIQSSRRITVRTAPWITRSARGWSSG